MQEVKFEPFQRVLVRQQNKSLWRDALFSHKAGTGAFCVSCAEFHASSKFWMQCIPFEGNERLPGTAISPHTVGASFAFGEHVEVSIDTYNWCKAVYISEVDYSKTSYNYRIRYKALDVNGDVSLWEHCRKANW